MRKWGQPRLEPTMLHCDNNSAILLANNLESHASTQHIDTKVHWISEIVKQRIVILKWIPGTEPIADKLTKLLEQIRFQVFVTRADMSQLD